MQYPNYQHLVYFYWVVKDGSIAAASKTLRLAQSSISTQIKTLESQLGLKLFKKEGRKLIVTEEGKNVYAYAEDIFNMGQELLTISRTNKQKNLMIFKVGFDYSLYKTVGYQLLAPLLDDKKIKIVCTNDSSEKLVMKLLAHEVDVVFTNAPIFPQLKTKVFCHLIGQASLAVFGNEALLSSPTQRFPQNLNNTPFLLPTNRSYLRRTLEEWFISKKVDPFIKAEIDDSALMKIFAGKKLGLMIAPVWAKKELKNSYNLEQIGVIKEIKESYYLISAQKKISNPITIRLIKKHLHKI